MRSVLVVLLLLAAACGAPITCPAHETARKELLCPACSPDDPCECHEGWVCREDPDAAAQRRLRNARAAEERQRRSAEQQERQREQARLLAAQRAAAEQAVLERQAREEQARREEQERLQSAYPAPLDAPPGCEAPCPRGQIRWTRFSCGTPEGPDAFFDNRPCPAGLPAGTRGCARPWRLESECVPDPDAPPARAARCLAPPGRCCLPDGRIVRPCGPIGRPGCNENTSLCGSGGFCNACR